MAQLISHHQNHQDHHHHHDRHGRIPSSATLFATVICFLSLITGSCRAQHGPDPYVGAAGTAVDPSYADPDGGALFDYGDAIASDRYDANANVVDTDIDTGADTDTQFNLADSDDEQPQAYLLPVSKPLGQVTGLGIDSKNRLFAFHRADRTWDEKSFDDKNRLNSTLSAIKNATIAIIDPQNGKVLEEHGQNMFYMPHGLTIDHQDNIWLTDVGLHQVMKLDKNFKVQLTLGERFKSGSDNQHFCKPTDVAIAHNGHIFVADGYCNSRVMKFDENGKFLSSFGTPNSGLIAEDGEFWIPHSLALIEDMNLICVADRENERIQCFSAGLTDGSNRAAIPTGMFITKAENVGRVYAIREKRHYLVGVTGSDGNGIESQLFVMDMNTGKANTFVKGIENAHALEISADGTVYIAQIGPNQIVQLSLTNQ